MSFRCKKAADVTDLMWLLSGFREKDYQSFSRSAIFFFSFSLGQRQWLSSGLVLDLTVLARIRAGRPGLVSLSFRLVLVLM